MNKENLKVIMKGMSDDIPPFQNIENVFLNLGFTLKYHSTFTSEHITRHRQFTFLKSTAFLRSLERIPLT